MTTETMVSYYVKVAGQPVIVASGIRYDRIPPKVTFQSKVVKLV